MSRAAWLGNFAQWGSAVASVLALAVSGATAYFSVLRQTEELRVSAIEPPRFFYDRETNTFRVGKKLAVIFVNSGNTPIVIRGVSVIINEDTRPNGCAGRGMDTDLEPFVIKEKELVQRTMALRLIEGIELNGVEVGNEFEFPPPKGFDRNDFTVKLCMNVSAITPTVTYAGGNADIGLTWSPGPNRASGIFGPAPMFVIWRARSWNID